MTQRRPTIQDVARAASVSTTTVSHALNNKGTMTPATRDRVISLARKMHYHPHPVAAGLRRGRTGVIGLDIRPLDSLGGASPGGVDHFVRFAGAAAITALGHDYGLMLVPDMSRGNVPATRAAVDGYIISDPVEGDPIADALIDEGRHVITVGRDPARPDFPFWVNTDDVGTARRVLDLLWSQGARHISLVTGTDQNSWNRDVEDTYQHWCGEHGVVEDLHRVPENDGLEGGERVVQKILESATPCDAIFCQTGRHAAGAFAAANRLGVAVPESLMVVAGSDSEHTRAAPGGITAVDLRPDDLGRVAVQMLVRLLSGESIIEPEIIEPRVIERGTTRLRT